MDASRWFAKNKPPRWLARILKWWGIHWVRHRTAYTVHQYDKFIRLMDAPDGNRWQRLRRHEVLGSEISLRPTYLPCSYDNLPTSLGEGRPVGISMTITVGYYFEPQNGTLPDAVERAIEVGQAGRNNQVTFLTRPALERITGGLNPIAVKLRQNDREIADRLVADLNRTLPALGLRVISALVNEVHLPKKLETELAAQIEHYRQSIEDYTPDDLARLMVIQMSEGMRKGTSHLRSPDIDPILVRSMTPEDKPPVVDAPKPPPSQPEPPPAKPQPPSESSPKSDARTWKKH